MKSFVAGLAIGGALGWGAAQFVRPTVEPSSPEARIAPAVVEPRQRPRSRSEETSSDAAPANAQTPEAPREDFTAQFLSGSAREIEKAMLPGRALSDAEVAALSGRLAATQGTGDSDLYVAMLRALGASRNALGRARLVEILADTSIPLGTLKTNVYGDIDRWLEDAGVVPGLAAAARKRYDAEPNAQSWTIGLGLMQMIGRHGDAADLAWLESKAGDTRTGTFALRAIPLCSDPAVDAAVERLWGARRTDSEWLAGYAARRPQAAIALSTRLLKRADAGEDVPDANALFDVLGRAAVASKDAAPVSELLPTLRTSAIRVAAVTAVQRLDDAKMDVTAFAPFLEEPVRLLESGEWETARIEMRYLVEYHQLLWTPRIAAALDTAADRTRDKDAAEGFRHVAKLIRDANADPWRRK